MQTRVHVFIYGQVQGVGFRYGIKKRMERLGVKGWVENLFDGSVEAEFEGEEEKVGEIVEWCKQGPPLARVKKVEISKT